MRGSTTKAESNRVPHARVNTKTQCVTSEQRSTAGCMRCKLYRCLSQYEEASKTSGATTGFPALLWRCLLDVICAPGASQQWTDIVPNAIHVGQTGEKFEGNKVQ